MHRGEDHGPTPSPTPFRTWINGVEYRRERIDPEWTLLQFLRSLGLTGTKLGCAEGGCGACTVMISTFTPHDKHIRHCSVNACLAPMASVHERHVITVEGVGYPSHPHPVQRIMAERHGSQCGFCTPGFVMSLYALLRNHPRPSERMLEEAFDGNLCRCTGYRPILMAARDFATCKGQRFCCGGDGGIATSSNCACAARSMAGTMEGEKSLSRIIPASSNTISPPQELIFPPSLRLHLEEHGRNMAIFTGRLSWYRPSTLNELLDLLKDHPDAKIIFGNTEVGVETKFKGRFYPHIIYGGDIPELADISFTTQGVEMGCGVTLSQMQKALGDFIQAQPINHHQCRSLKAVYEALRWFAGRQIRNVSSWAGNVATASPISDLNPVFASLRAKLTLLAADASSRSISFDRFILGYRKTALKAGEIIRSIYIPFSQQNEHIFFFKQSKRRDDDIAIVNAALRVVLGGTEQERLQVADCEFAFGGMGPTTLLSQKAKAYCIGQSLLDPSILQPLLDLLSEEFSLAPDAVGGMPEYRMSLMRSLFFKFYLCLLNEASSQIELDTRICSAIEPRHRSLSKSCQTFSSADPSKSTGHPLPHLSALKHTTGNAEYLDDLPHYHGELYAGLVLSTKAHARIKSLDFSEARRVEGVVEVVTAADIPGINRMGPVMADENVLVEDTVTACGQILAIIVATNQMIAQRAAHLVKVEYEVLPHLLTIQDAIQAGSFFTPDRFLNKGDAKQALRDWKGPILEGQVHIGGQEHFYLETQAALVVPKSEDGEIEVIASSQNPSEVQHFVAKILALPINRVQCRVRRLGGGFGGKETRTSLLTAAIALAAWKTGRPVRCMLDRDEDMIWSGQRHPFYLRYRLALTADSGKFEAADLDVYSNGGYSLDLSLGVLERALSHIDNVYNFPHMYVHGRICKTNLPSNTAFRGFGAPQANFFCETMVMHAAQVLSLPAEQIRKTNMYRDGDMTPFGMKIEEPPLERMWQQLMQQTHFEERKKVCEEYNRRNRWRKRGITIIPSKFGIAFGVKHLNQAGALVHLYTDGTIYISHGGVEMGQGLHTKMCQIAADVFQVPTSLVHLGETSTSHVPNASPTAASSSSDLYGMAIQRACASINERLAPYRLAHPTATIKEIAKMAYMDRVDLSAHGFYSTPGIGFDWNTQKGQLYNYFTYGMCCSEIELDVLTGDHQILRTDIIMDLGRSLNPAIDIGQIEGAFVQGLGLFTIEQPLYFPQTGLMMNRGPGAYKIPTASDIPLEFNVFLLEGSLNPRAIHSSKGIGEPPLFLSASVLFAIQEAVISARHDAFQEFGKDKASHPPLLMDSPASVERIRLACLDHLVNPDGVEIDPRANDKAWVIEV